MDPEVSPAKVRIGAIRMVCGKGAFKSAKIFLDQRVPNCRRIPNTFGFSFRRVERSALCFRGSRSVNRDCRGLAAARAISAKLASVPRRARGVTARAISI